jgi:hypothetical protein
MSKSQRGRIGDWRPGRDISLRGITQPLSLSRSVKSMIFFSFFNKFHRNFIAAFVLVCLLLESSRLLAEKI